MGIQSKKFSLFLIFLCLIGKGLCQQEWDLQQLESQLLEETDAAKSGEELFDEEKHKELSRNPIRLNQVKKEDLDRIPGLSEIEKNAILDYLTGQKKIMSPLELQTIEELSFDKLKGILPYFTVSEKTTVSRQKLRSWLSPGTHHMVMRWERELQNEDEYQSLDGNPPKFQGSPDKLFMRYRSSLPGQYSLGFLMEKDAGEKLWNSSIKGGVDYFSAHLFLQKLSPVVENLAIGDFRLRIGQGLILDNAFQNSRTFDFGMFVKNPNILKPYNSLQENQMLRGVATQLNLGNGFQATMFYSNLKTDATLLEADTTGDAEILGEFTSIITSGLHRTEAELRSRNALGIQDYGLSVIKNIRRGHVGISAISTQFEINRKESSEPYKYFENRLRTQRFYSIYHQYNWGGFYLFGEVAGNENLDLSVLQGVVKALGKKSDLVALYRNFSPAFQSIRAQSLAVNNRSSNENGFLFGFNHSIHKNWKVGTFFDTWNHPWLRYRVDLPSQGRSWSFRLSYTERKKWLVYLQFRSRITEINETNHSESSIEEQINHNLRLHAEQKLTDEVNLRYRIEYHRFQSKEKVETGWLSYWDWLFKGVEDPYSFNLRFCLFDIPSYSTRIYTFENDVPGIFRIPAYQGMGGLIYINARYRLFRSLSLEGKYSVIYKPSSSNPGISQEYNHDVHLQLQCRF